MGKVRTPGGIEVDEGGYRSLFAAVKRASERRKAACAQLRRRHTVRAMAEALAADADLTAALAALEAYARS